MPGTSPPPRLWLFASEGVTNSQSFNERLPSRLVSEGDKEMPKFTASVCINRSPQDIFDFLSKPENFQQWMPNMQSAAWTSSGEPGIGSTVRAMMKMAGKEMELLVKITRWDPPNRWDFKILNPVFPLKVMEHVHRLQPEDGGTRVTLDGEYEVVSRLRMAAGLMGKMAARMNGRELNKAKQLLEAS
jgi:uncharacterized protein YndB with AHSA1/START domain